MGGEHQVRAQWEVQGRLRATLEKLDDAITAATEELRVEFPETDPLLMKDNNGRYFLLESLTALANGLAVLAK